jgi:hypothetical protein
LEGLGDLVCKNLPVKISFPAAGATKKHLLNVESGGTGLRVVIVGENYEEKLLQKTRINRFSVTLMRFLLVCDHKFEEIRFLRRFGTGTCIAQ